MANKKSLLGNWKVLLWIIFVLGSMSVIFFNGLTFGSEFSGGTLFQLQLAEPASNDQLSEIKLIVEKRLNPTGIKDVVVSSTGQSIVLAQVAETDPVEVSNLQSLLLKQGRFESFINGGKIFDGSQIVQVVENPQQGYGAIQTENGYQWTLPFLLNDEAAKQFTKSSFHQCTQTGFGEYDCAYTFFFIDRPINSIVVYPFSVQEKDEGKLSITSSLQIPPSITIDDILENANLNLVRANDNQLSEFDSNLLGNPPENVRNVMIPSSLNRELKERISNSTSLEIVEVNEMEDSAWLVSVSGLRDIISLTPGVANLDPFVEKVEDAVPFQFLVIQGTAPDAETAKQRLNDLRVLLKSGALPIPIISINKQTVSAELGERFLTNVWAMGLLALLVVAAIIFIRYRKIKLAVPVLAVGLSEVVMILGFAAVAKWNLDLASMAGILAAVGTGVDSQIIMTDEMLHGQDQEEESKDVLKRAKRAFFIVATSSATSIATMLPLVILGSGIGRLSGFALTTIVGVLMGVLISRPAYQQIIQHILTPEEELLE